MEELLAYYKKQGAPSEQNALIALLKEIQAENGGSIPASALVQIGESYGVKTSFLEAVVKRIPSLRVGNQHCLELCGGPNCSKRARLGEYVEKIWGKNPKGFVLKYGSCMRLCGKGPNIKWDGKVYHGADEALIRHLIEDNI